MTQKKSPPDTPAASQPALPDRPGLFSLLGTASTMGLHMVTGPVVGAGLGWLADRWLDSWPAGSAIGLLLGVAAGFRNVWADARYLIRAQEPGSDQEPGAAPSGPAPGSAVHRSVPSHSANPDKDQRPGP